MNPEEIHLLVRYLVFPKLSVVERARLERMLGTEATSSTPSVLETATVGSPVVFTEPGAPQTWAIVIGVLLLVCLIVQFVYYVWGKPNHKYALREPPLPQQNTAKESSPSGFRTSPTSSSTMPSLVPVTTTKNIGNPFSSSAASRKNPPLRYQASRFVWRWLERMMFGHGVLDGVGAVLLIVYPESVSTWLGFEGPSHGTLAMVAGVFTAIAWISIQSSRFPRTAQVLFLNFKVVWSGTVFLYLAGVMIAYAATGFAPVTRGYWITLVAFGIGFLMWLLFRWNIKRAPLNNSDDNDVEEAVDADDEPSFLQDTGKMEEDSSVTRPYYRPVPIAKNLSHRNVTDTTTRFLT